LFSIDCERARRLVARSSAMKVGAGLRVVEAAADADLTDSVFVSVALAPCATSSASALMRPEKRFANAHLPRLTIESHARKKEVSCKIS
jgi:hypothetical protein